ncbi:MAG: Gfo/Idh/MocA family protein, partial [Terriglobia bacterium]
IRPPTSGTPRETVGSVATRRSSLPNMKVAIIGCGAVGSIHAAKLREGGSAELVATYSPNAQKAAAFAAAYGVERVAPSVADAISKADLAVICSPSYLHFAQARECLEAGVQTLVELPPCATASEAEELAELARKRGVRLGCAHTSRYLLPYVWLKENLQRGVLGEIQEVSYLRHHRLRARSWSDNALLHHAAHSIDLLLYWCGGLDPKACIAQPNVAAAQSVSVLGKLPGGGLATINVSYASRLPQTRMVIVGKKHTVETDGFTYLRSDLPQLQFQGDEQEVYEQAVRDQDAEFLGACQGKGTYVSWDETIKLIRTVNQFQALAVH